MGDDEFWRQPGQIEAILSGIAEGITIQDSTGRLLYANEIAARMCGFATPQEMLASPLEVLQRVQISDESGAPISPERFPGRRALEGEVAPEMLVHVREADGSDHWRVVKARLIQDEAGKPLAAVNIFYDVTESRRNEERQAFLAAASGLLASSLDYRVTLERVARLGVPRLADWCCVHLVEDNGELRPIALAHVNRQKEELAWELQRRYPPGRDDPEGLPKVVRTGKAALYSEIPDWLIEAIAKDAEHLRLLRSVGLKSGMSVPLIARGHTLGAITFASDESGRRYDADQLSLAEELARRAAMAIDNARLHHHAQQALRAREDFLAVVSHDLKNPLSAILLNVHQCLRRLPPNEPSTRMQTQLATIQNAAHRIDRLIRDLLDSASLDAGNLVLDRATVPVSKLLAEAVEMMTPMAQARSLRFETVAQPPQLVVDCDRERVLQILSSLLGNAIKFTPNGGAASLRVEPLVESPQWIRFAVADTGPGIPEDQRAHVFEQYWQGEPASSHGSGLGVYIAKRLVEAHQGRLWFETAEGKGTTFFFTLPAAR